MLLAQCADPANCDIPRSLPWYFSVAMIAGWAALVAGIVVLVVWILRARADRRPRRSRFRGHGGRKTPAISSGTRTGGPGGGR